MRPMFATLVLTACGGAVQATAPAAPSEGGTVRFVHTAHMEGELEPCG